MLQALVLQYSKQRMGCKTRKRNYTSKADVHSGQVIQSFIPTLQFLSSSQC